MEFIIIVSFIAAIMVPIVLMGIRKELRRIADALERLRYE